MLPKARRIPREQFKAIIERSKFSNSPHFSLRVAKNEGVGARIAVSVSKKVSKKAVLRNRTRRRVYSALQESISTLPNNLYLIIAKPGAEKLKGEALKNELTLLIRSIKN